MAVKADFKVIKVSSPDDLAEQLAEAGMTGEQIEEALETVAKQIMKHKEDGECSCGKCSEEEEEKPEEVVKAMKVLALHSAKSAIHKLFDMLEKDFDLTIDRDTAVKAIFENKVH